MKYAIKEYIDPMGLQFHQDRYLEQVRVKMAHQLARAFIERLVLLKPERDPRTGECFLFCEMEITDRMEQDHIRAMGRCEGRMIGQSEIFSKIPYGLNPDEVWE